jgi:hypothetical protein
VVPQVWSSSPSAESTPIIHFPSASALPAAAGGAKKAATGSPTGRADDTTTAAGAGGGYQWYHLLLVALLVFLLTRSYMQAVGHGPSGGAGHLHHPQ